MNMFKYRSHLLYTDDAVCDPYARFVSVAVEIFSTKTAAADVQRKECTNGACLPEFYSAVSFMSVECRQIFCDGWLCKQSYTNSVGPEPAGALQETVTSFISNQVFCWHLGFIQKAFQKFFQGCQVEGMLGFSLYFCLLFLHRKHVKLEGTHFE